MRGGLLWTFQFELFSGRLGSGTAVHPMATTGSSTICTGPSQSKGSCVSPRGGFGHHIGAGHGQMTVAAVSVAARSHDVGHAHLPLVVTTTPSAHRDAVGDRQCRYHHFGADRLAWLVLESR
jgi:hypothetical protein